MQDYCNDAIRLNGIDYVEFYVGNALQASHYYRSVLGFKISEYAGPETGVRDRTSILVEQGFVRILLTSAQSANSPVADHVLRHGDGVKDIAFIVDDSIEAFEKAMSRGAQPIQEPAVYEDGGGKLVKSSIAVFGNICHSFIQRDDYHSRFLPNFRPVTTTPKATPSGISAIDHIAVGVENGDVDRWADYYKSVFGFHQSMEEGTTTEYSAMNSKVVQNDTGRIITVILEPVPGRQASQIDEYLKFNAGSGVHHIALLTENIIQTVSSLRANGLEFTSTPAAYYEDVRNRVGKITEDLSLLKDLNILIDRDEWGYLMQIFSKPVQTRPTFFFEIIQRRGARGFGSGNIKALFEAIEREQALRGNLGLN